MPSIMHGNIAGIAAITGLPVIKKEVMGVMMLKIIPQVSPAYTTVKIRAAFIIGPVIYTLKFLRNWLTIHIASMIAVSVICFVFIFIKRLLIFYVYLQFNCKQLHNTTVA